MVFGTLGLECQHTVSRSAKGLRSRCRACCRWARPKLRPSGGTINYADLGQLSLFGGIATIVPGSDCVSTFRGEGVEPDLVALALANHVLTLPGRDGAGLGLRPAGGRRGGVSVRLS